jgi:MFS family permease
VPVWEDRFSIVNEQSHAQGRVLGVLAVGVLDVGLEQALVAPALPAIERHYGASPTTGVWVLTGFVLAAAVAIPVAGRLGDRVGRRRALLGSLGCFALGALISAVSQSMGILVAGRVIQGLGAGVAPLAVAVARDHVSRERFPAAVGAVIAAGSIGTVAGLLVAGRLVDHVSVSAIFWFLCVAAALLACLVAVVVPESAERSADPIDLFGALLLGAALGLVTVAISEGNRWGWGSARTLLFFAAAAVALGALIARERLAATPLLDPRALALRSIWSANVAMFGLGFSLLIAFSLVPLIGAYPKLTGYGLGLTTTQVGLVLVPGAVATLVAGPIGGRLIRRTGARAQALAATLLATLTYVLLAMLSPTVAVLAIASIPLGLGIGLGLGAITDLVALASPRSQTAANVGLNTVLRTVATALGAQVAAAVVAGAPPALTGPRAQALRTLATHTAARAPAAARHLLSLLALPAHAGFTHAFWMAAAATVVALLAVCLTPARRADPTLAAE